MTVVERRPRTDCGDGWGEGVHSWSFFVRNIYPALSLKGITGGVNGTK